MPTIKAALSIAVSNPSTTSFLVNQALETAKFDMTALVSAGYVDAEGAGLRIQYKGVDIARAPDLDFGFNATNSQMWFPTQATIAAGATNTTDYLMVCYSGASTPAYDLSVQHVIANATDYLLPLLNGILFQNQETFGTGETYWQAAPSYSTYGSFSADVWLAIDSAPELFTATQINNIVLKMNQPNGSNLLPVNVQADGTPRYNVGVGNGYDSMWTLPMMTLAAFNKNSDTTTFATVKSNLIAALNAVPSDNNLFFADPTASPNALSWGFYDAHSRNGHNTAGTVFFIRACQAMIPLCNAVGDITNANLFDAQAQNSILSLQDPSNGLWDASGMLLISDGTDNAYEQIIDIFGSCHAVYMGYLTTDQASIISDWLHTNLASIVNAQGFVRESTFPSTPGTYDDGYWSYGLKWVLTALAINHPADAQTLITRFCGSFYESIEWIGNTTASVGNGANLESPFSVYAYCRDNPTFVNQSATYSGADYSTVFPYWANGQQQKGLTLAPNAYGFWSKNSATWDVAQSNHNNNRLTFTGIRGGFDATHYTMEADFKVISFAAADHPIASIVGNSPQDIVDTSNQLGLCAAFRGTDQTTASTLTFNVAWGNTAAFVWTTGTFYRMKLRRVGNVISLKVWVPGAGEPATYNTGFTPSNAAALMAQYFGIDAGFGNIQFKNVIMNGGNSADASVVLGVPQTVAAMTVGTPTKSGADVAWSWTVVGGASSYQVSKDGGAFSTTGVSGTSYTDIGGAGGPHTYTVRAFSGVDLIGEGSANYVVARLGAGTNTQNLLILGVL